MKASTGTIRSSAIPQPVAIPLTRAAIFLVVTVNRGVENRTSARALSKDLSSLVRAVGSREQEEILSCVMGFGSDAWDNLFGRPRPKELHEFREIVGAKHRAVSTPGDIIFHIRAQRMDLCFELATQITARLGPAISQADEVHGFRYFDSRDFIGFVDGTENPAGQDAVGATLIADEDPTFSAGSYVIVQEYLHDLEAWNKLTTEEQERIIGRTKLSDIELDDKVKPTNAHNALTKLVKDGREIKILRDNMSFGHAGKKEFGTYFIGYSRSPRERSRRCSRTCLWASLAAIMTGFWILAELSRGAYSSCLLQLFWRMSKPTRWSCSMKISWLNELSLLQARPHGSSVVRSFLAILED